MENVHAQRPVEAFLKHKNDYDFTSVLVGNKQLFNVNMTY